MRVITLLLVTAIILSITPSNEAKTSKKKHKKSKDTNKQQIALLLKDLSQLNELQHFMRQGIPAITTENTTTTNTGISATRQGPCNCAKGVCTCCSRILLNFLRQKACVNVTYDPDEFAFTAKVSMNDNLIFTRTVSGKNPRPVCVPVPRFPVVRACIRFYNIYFQGRNVHACVNMEGKFRDTTLFKVGMDCLRLGSNGVALVKPEDGGGIGQIEVFPEDPGSDSGGGDDYDDYDEYDEDDDGDDDDDDLFDY